MQEGLTPLALTGCRALSQELPRGFERMKKPHSAHTGWGLV